MLGSLRKTTRMVITHDAYQTCGVAAEIAQRMMETAFDYLDAPIARVTGTGCAGALRADRTCR